jgi:apolipoprotein N-acyltransferase
MVRHAMKLSRLKYSLLCLCAGAIMVLALPPFNIWPLMFAGFSLFYAMLAGTKSRRAAFAGGWLFGFGYFAPGLWWIANALLVDGNEFRWVWPLAISGLPALLGFFPALASLACVRFDNGKKMAGFLCFLAAFAFSEWLRGHIFTGFPWNLYGYAWSGWLEMAQVVSVGGPYFLTLLTHFWSALPGFLFIWDAPRSKKIFLLCVGLASLAANGIYGCLRLSHYATAFDQTVAIRPVQANISQADKWNPHKVAENLNKRLALTPDNDQQKFDVPLTLVIWPETAMEDNVLANENARALIRAALAEYKNKVYLITGLLHYKPGPDGKMQYFNSLVVLDRDLNERALYSKSHLVPFGEYIPFQNILPLKPFVSFEGFTSGGGVTSLSLDAMPVFSPLICYEVVFPGAVIARSRPALMINVTNDAWYGDSPGPRQHFAMTRFRAIEEGIPMVRAAETGISGVIDPLGRVIWQAPLNTKDARNIALPRPLAEPTLYARVYPRDIIFLICLFLTGMAAFFCRAQGTRKIT